MSINVGYFTRESITNFRRNWVMSLGAVITIYLSLLLVGVSIAVGVVGVVFCGFAGRWKERDQAQPGGAPPNSRNLLIGLALCSLAGVLSAVYGISLTEGAPIAKLAEEHAKGHTVLGIDAATFCSNAIYPFSNSGAFLTTALYCLFLHFRHRTLGEIVVLPEGEEKASLPVNWAMEQPSTG